MSVNEASHARERAHGPSAIRQAVTRWRSEGLRVAFVPTMGALHEGHLSLVDLALAHADRVVASIFVNPKQFAPGEDFESYPRTFDDDRDQLRARGCHVLYAPRPADMYPDGFATTVRLTGPALELESAARPHFFDGVATVVAKLLNQVRPDCAVFGEKDYQQLLVVRQMVRDLDLGVEIIAGPTARADDGLALSSRNANLSAAQRRLAPQLYAVLRHAASALMGGVSPAVVEDHARTALARTGFDEVDYVAVRDAATLGGVGQPAPGQALRVLAAVRLGAVRLIDNIGVTPD